MEEPQHICTPPCPALLELKKRMDDLSPVLSLIPRMADKVDAMALSVQNTQDIVKAWENAKGFVNTIQILSSTVKILAPIAGVFLVVSHLMKKAGLM